MNDLLGSKILKFTFKELEITDKTIELHLGITDGNETEPFRQYIHEVLDKAQKLENICAGYEILEPVLLDFEKNTFTICGTKFETGKIVAWQLRKSTSVAVFVCTAGYELEEFSRQQMKIGNIPEAYVADIVGSVIVEKAMDKAQSFLSNSMKEKGLGITNRYSPGYCEWKVDEQQKLFSLLPNNICNIRLTESSLMQPIKSVSGIIGIGPTVKLNPYTCKICGMKDCIYRNLKSH